MHNTKSVFLTANWEYLAMFNYEIDPAVLLPFLPVNTILDTWQGKVLVSMVGFMFNNTKVFGINWPMHTHFEEVNLRFYVKHFDGKNYKRGVAFVSEIVPKPVIAYTANALYNEHYRALPMKHSLEFSEHEIKVSYDWKFKNKWNTMGLTAIHSSNDIENGTTEEFIFEHYWGYNQLNKNTTVEYGVEHNRWQVFPVSNSYFDCDVASLYGKSFVPFLKQEPHSVFLAKGSAVTIRKPIKIKSIKHLNV